MAATIRISSNIPVVQSALKVRPLRVTIDGGEERNLSMSGSSDIEVGAGSHRVEMYVAWALPARMGPAQINVSVQDGETVELVYKPPWIRTMPGKLTLSTYPRAAGRRA
jgi:hypothetical protein